MPADVSGVECKDVSNYLTINNNMDWARDGAESSALDRAPSTVYLLDNLDVE